MIPNADNQRQIQRYLLGELTPEELQQVEVRLLDDEEFAAQVQLVEEELIEDYLAEALPPSEHARYEAHFLAAPHRQGKLALGRALRRYAMSNSETKSVQEAGRGATGLSWLAAFFTPRWRVAAFALIMLGVGMGVWRTFVYQSPVEKGLRALNQAYSKQRPLEARVTKFGYAPFSVTRGKEAEPTEYRARELAEKTLLEAVEDGGGAAAYHALGRAYLAKKELAKAAEQFEAALKLTPADAQLHSDLGAALLEKGKLERLNEQTGQSEVTLAKSLEQFDRALELDGSLPEARFNRALLYELLHLPQQAQADWEKYLETDSQSPWVEEARRHLKSLNESKKSTTQNRERLYQDFRQAWQEDDRARAWQALRASYSRTGNEVAERLLDAFLDLSLKGQDAEAKRKLRALAFAGEVTQQRAGETYLAGVAEVYRKAAPQQLAALAQARRWLKAGHEFYAHSEIDQALEQFAQAREKFAQIGDTREALFAAYWIGACHYLKNDTNASIQVFEQVRQASLAQGSFWLASAAFNGLATAYSPGADYSLGISYTEHSSQFAARLGDSYSELRSAVMLAGFYRLLGKYDECLSTARHGLQLAEQVGMDRNQIGALYSNFGMSLNALKLNDAALSFQQAAVSLAREQKNSFVLSRYLVYLGLIYRQRGQYQQAVQALQEGLAYGKKLGDSTTGQELVNYALLNLGHVQRETGDFAAAITTYNRVLAFSEAKGTLLLRHWAHKGRLLTYLKQGDNAVARRELQQVLAWLEQYREKILEESNRNSFFDTEQDFYDIAIDFALIQERNPYQAFEYAEQSRARSLLDASQGRKAVIHTAVATDLRLKPAPPLRLDAVQRQMPERAQLLQYAVLEDKVAIWLLTKDHFESCIVNVKTTRLSQLVGEYVEQLSHPPTDNQAQVSGAGEQLYDLLLQPVEAWLDRDRLLCIVPDKMLHRLPFSALAPRKTGKYLLETYLLCYAPSANMFLRASVLASQKAGWQSERLLSVGNPRFNPQAHPELADLPSAAREADAVAALYADHCLLVERQATKEAVIEQLNRADVVHLALHNLPDHTSPLRSKLVLAAPPGAGATEEDVLSADEIYQQQLTRARLVVLSACQTRASAYYGGEGAIGISRPFEMAGIPLIVASLWPVDSAATTALMIRFHQARKRAGMATAPALGTAQRALLSETDGLYRHPYYWASFVVIGGLSDF